MGTFSEAQLYFEGPVEPLSRVKRWRGRIEWTDIHMAAMDSENVQSPGDPIATHSASEMLLLLSHSQLLFLV